MHISAIGSNEGILFRSYDVPSEHRTSVVLSGNHGAPLVFSDSLSFSFSLKLNLDKGKFGYIFRLAIDDMLPFDFLLSPEKEKPVFCVTADHKKVLPLVDIVENVEEWNDIYVDVVEKADSLVFFINHAPVVSVHTSKKRHQATLYFGKTDKPGLLTSDVAPMLLADLKVCLDKGKGVSWQLSGTEVLTPKQGIYINITNPFFISGLKDRWTKMWSSDLPSTSYVCISQDVSKFYIISSNQVIEYEIASGKISKNECIKDIDIRKVAGEFLCMPDGSLCYADMETGKIIRYDRVQNDWVSDNIKERVSVHLHHNTVYVDTTCYQMFGYGQHRYSSEVFAWTPALGLAASLNIEGLAPRYLAGAAARNGKIYVLGGKGNISGLQELGTQYYDSFTEVDPMTETACDIWKNNLLKRHVAAKDIVFSKDGKSFLALLYNPEINETSLQLTRFSVNDGDAEFLFHPLPYRFTDLYSDARLCYNEDCDIYLAILCYKSEAGQNKVDVYILGNQDSDERTLNVNWTVIVLLGCVLATLVVGGFYCFSKKSIHFVLPNKGLSCGKEEIVYEPACQESSDVMLIQDRDDMKCHGIHLLGGFHVFDISGAEITTSFSPVLLQLLTILALYTAENGGVSNAILKELLWPDKSDDKFNNNKGVNITKLRKLLASVGDVTIVSDNGLWSLRDPSRLCDYMVAKQRLFSGKNEDILKVAMLGPLLPEYHFEWLDSFKSEYADFVISRLTDISMRSPSSENKLKFADAWLKFDSLDEEAIYQKCQALISLGKAGAAKAVFEHFAEEYSAVMGETFSVCFSDFLKSKLH